MNIVTVKELSTILKVKEGTLYQWAGLGQIPCIKLNGSLRFDLGDINKWINGCKKEPDSRYNSLTQARSPRKGVDK
jgi:excisionase family DNA binding protein